jgi:hypothetical protein
MKYNSTSKKDFASIREKIGQPFGELKKKQPA